MRIKRTSNIEHRTSNSDKSRAGIECGSQTAANSFGVRSRIAGFNVQCSPFQPSAFSLQHCRRGVALIITIILLGVVTFMAIAFLALSRRERGAVTTVTDTASARLAADSALANAEAQIMANALATTNPYSFGLLVSTNYIYYAGFLSGNTNFYNVNYQYPGGNSLSINDFLQNLANLWYSPRPPVFISNPTNSSLPPDFRYYLDLNRNGRYDTNGWVENFDNNNNDLHSTSFQVGDPEWIGVLQRPDQPYGPNNPFVARYAFIAVPAGNTLDLNAIHNQVFDEPSAPGINQIYVNPGSANQDDFFRNQGVGSWEINLAAFLADLNTNQWDPPTIWNSLAEPYQYPEGTIGNSTAFDDARALLAWRYNNNYNSLLSVDTLFGGASSAGYFAFINDGIDGYSDGPLQITMDTNADYYVADKPASPWVGADNTNHFFTHQELFDPNKTAINVSGANNFTSRLLAAGNSVSTYDRYTFYRLLAQLGTDSTPESGKMNLNYDNLDPTNGVAASTNFMAWTPLAFFTNAADRLLRAYTTQWRNGNPTKFATTFYTATNFNFINADQWTNYPAFGIGRIPVLVSNQFVYSSAVNRLLQLAANMYDATTNYYYPSVFHPTFWVTNEYGYNNVYINGYQQVVSVSGANDPQLTMLQLPGDATTLASGLHGSTAITYPSSGVNVYGVPWIIGAKKGFPNFNKFAMQDVIQIQRKLQLKSTKVPASEPSDIIITNQMYIFGISNSIGMDLWNSYAATNSDSVQIVAHYNLRMLLTNDAGVASVYTNFSTNVSTYFSPWAGNGWTSNNLTTAAANSFYVPIATTVPFLTNSVWYSGSSPPGVSGFYPAGANGNGLGWETTKPVYPLPQFGLQTTNRLQVFMLDGNHVIDYVQFAGPDSSYNLNAKFQTSGQGAGFEYQWSTNLDSLLTPYGIRSQIAVSLAEGVDQGSQSTYWNGTSSSQVSDEQAGFEWYMGRTSTIDTSNPTQAQYTNTTVQVPYTPTATIYEFVSWQANDPLVHYLASDLNFQGTENSPYGPTTGINTLNSQSVPMPRPGFYQLNDRYQPWGVLLTNNISAAEVDVNRWNLMYKDPLVRISDNWDFPANKFPTVGWLGRVHRGTPWQTVYLKASDILNETYTNGSTIYYVGAKTWAQWTGDSQLTFGQYFDAGNTAPVQDRLLFDLFTTAFNDNATRGTLSVNQDHLAAWSAVFSGVTVLSNNVPDNHASKSYYVQFQKPPPGYSVTNIQPAGLAGTNSTLYQLVNGINQTRANTNLFPSQSFAHVGDILSVPQFTEQSPFLTVVTNAAQQRNGISDEMYEWLPQQTMSLLRVSDSPRYVIYCYGQALKPAPDSVYTGSQNNGAYFGMITNYQVVSEIATRAVVRFNSMVTNVITTPDGTNWYSQPVVTNNNAVIESFNVLPPD
jgi:hypothetical protein